jgi:hypothetical protein
MHVDHDRPALSIAKGDRNASRAPFRAGHLESDVARLAAGSGGGAGVVIVVYLAFRPIAFREKHPEAPPPEPAPTPRQTRDKEASSRTCS